MAGVVGTSENQTRRAGFLIALAFFLGIVVNLTLLGAVAGRFGAILTESFGRYWALTMAVLSFAAAIVAFRGPRLNVDRLAALRRPGSAGTFGYGFIFSLGASAAPLLLLLTVAATQAEPLYGALIAFVFGLGRGLPFLLEGLFAGALIRLTRIGIWRRAIQAVIQADPLTDLAIVRINASRELTEARFGAADQLSVGDWVVAVGNTFGMGLSVYPSSISATGRWIGNSHVPVLQTNAVSTPESSGGPLLNLRGEVVGIIQGVYSAAGGYDGIAFAIPADVVEFVVDGLLTNGRVRWPYLGASTEKLTPDVARALGLRGSQTGAVLTDVTPGTPAAGVGLRPGDVITRFAGRPIQDSTSLSAAIQHTRIDEPVEFTVVRNARPSIHEVRLCPRTHPTQTADDAATASGRPAEHAADRFCGLDVGELVDPRHPDAGGLQQSEGVLVEKVQRQSTAYQKGIRPGMIITHVGTAPVRSADEFQAAMLGQRLKDGVLLLVRPPNSGGHFILLRPEVPNISRSKPTARAQ